ncbi:hypothetical protein CRYUN_Cryun16bG0040500 [Craigia yunnanensis]
MNYAPNINVLQSCYGLLLCESVVDSLKDIISRINFDLNYSIRFEDAVFCNGKIHWNCYWKDSLYFDLENESLETLPMPISTMEAPMERSYFAECRGILYVAVTYFIVVCLEFDVFEMASDYFPHNVIPFNPENICIALSDEPLGQV